MSAGIMKAKLPCIAKANKAVRSVQAVGISAPTNADDNDYARYGNEAAHDKKEHNNDSTYYGLLQAAS
jgi:hypothetical protein